MMYISEKMIIYTKFFINKMNSDIYNQIIDYVLLPEKIKYFSEKQTVSIDEVKLLVNEYLQLREKWNKYLKNMMCSDTITQKISNTKLKFIQEKIKNEDLDWFNRYSIEDFTMKWSSVYDFNLMCFLIKSELEACLSFFPHIKFLCTHIITRGKNKNNYCSEHTNLLYENGHRCGKHLGKEVLNISDYLAKNLELFASLYYCINELVPETIL